MHLIFSKAYIPLQCRPNANPCGPNADPCGPNASPTHARRWNIGCVGSPCAGARVGHVHFIFVVLISLGTQSNPFFNGIWAYVSILSSWLGVCPSVRWARPFDATGHVASVWEIPLKQLALEGDLICTRSERLSCTRGVRCEASPGLRAGAGCDWWPGVGRGLSEEYNLDLNKYLYLEGLGL